jgi:alanyl-tRNA synthetase
MCCYKINRFLQKKTGLSTSPRKSLWRVVFSNLADFDNFYYSNSRFDLAVQSKSAINDSALHRKIKKAMNNQSLYLHDPFTFEFEATVQEKIEHPNGTFWVVLDQTYFYPSGGGQEHDTGWLGDAGVVDVLIDRDRDVVIHVLNRDISSGLVKAKIDWERRFRHMQHHTAQHLLSQCFVRLFDMDTVSAHINGYSTSTIDIPIAQLNREDLNRVESLANQIIYENRTVKSYFVTPEEIADLPLRKMPKVSENIRIVEIDSFDYSACGATHCTQTGMIGVIKIIKTENQNQKTRSHFVAGIQALEEFQNYHDIVSSLAGRFSTHPQELADIIFQQSDRLRTIEKELASLRMDQIDAEAQKLISQSEKVSGNQLVIASFEDRPIKEIRTLANETKRVEKLIAILAAYENKKMGILVTCGQETGLSAKELLQQILIIINGRGGGDEQIAQGGGTIGRKQFDLFVGKIRQCVNPVIHP